MADTQYVAKTIKARVRLDGAVWIPLDIRSGKLDNNQPWENGVVMFLDEDMNKVPVYATPAQFVVVEKWVKGEKLALMCDVRSDARLQFVSVLASPVAAKAS